MGPTKAPSRTGLAKRTQQTASAALRPDGAKAAARKQAFPGSILDVVAILPLEEGALTCRASESSLCGPVGSRVLARLTPGPGHTFCATESKPQFTDPNR